jgi:hypothetical protein
VEGWRLLAGRKRRDNMGKIGKIKRSNQKVATLAVSGEGQICKRATLQIIRLAVSSSVLLFNEMASMLTNLVQTLIECDH